MLGSAADLRRRHDVQVGAGVRSDPTRTTTLEQLYRLKRALARGASIGCQAAAWHAPPTITVTSTCLSGLAVVSPRGERLPSLEQRNACQRVLEAPAPAYKPLTGSAADLHRHHDVPVGARGSSALPRTTTLEQQQRLTACARGASIG